MYAIRSYYDLLGERQGMTDLMAWNADATRVPFAMQSELLRSLFLRNDLAEGRYRVEGKPAVISDIRVPIFCVATHRITSYNVCYTKLLRKRVLTSFIRSLREGGVCSPPRRTGCLSICRAWCCGR